MKRLRRAFSAHKGSAKQRGIAFNFTWDEWFRWWIVELAKKGPNATRGTMRGEYMMCRKQDMGGYEPLNVYCGTAKENYRDRL